MPITFTTKSYADITMLNDVGETMLKIMNFGMVVPGAIAAKDIGQAISNLQSYINSENSQVGSGKSEEDSEPEIALETRAIPLIRLLQSADASGNNISWR